MKFNIALENRMVLYKYFFLFIFILSSSISISADKKERYDIKWIGEFKSTKSWDDESGLITKLYNLIMGENQTSLIRPVNLCAYDNLFWILDQGSQSVTYIDFTNKESEIYFDGNGSGYPSLVGICKDNKGNIYYTDSQKNQIVKLNFDSDGKENFTNNIEFNKPTGIAFSEKSKNIYICETGNHRIVVLNPKGELINSIGVRGKGKGEFNFPTFIWIDKNELIYVVDSMNFRVQVFDDTGKVISIFGETGDGSGNMARPKGIATDSFGHIYIVDALFHNVQVFNLNGDFLYSFGGQGRKQSEFWLPMGIFIDESNKIYVSDSYNSRIQIFQLEKGKDIEN